MSAIDNLRNFWKILFLSTVLCYSSNENVVLADGNIGCLFAETLCIETVEWCHDDFAFGKCLAQYGLAPEELFREPLSEEQSGLLATMLEDLQGAGLGWEHPFVQCRMQGALFSIRNESPMPTGLCASLTPDPQIFGPQSPLAFVRFTPPNDDFADEVYYPPGDKKAFDDRIYMDAQPPEYIPDLDEIEDILSTTLDKDEIENRRKNIKNRIELRQMLAEYESGNLKPPIYHKSGMLEDDNSDLSAVNNRNENAYGTLLEEEKRTSPYKVHNDEISKLLNEFQNSHKTKKEETEPSKTIFREVAREQHIPLEASYYERHNNDIPEDSFNLQRDQPNRVLVNMNEDLSANEIEENSHGGRNNLPTSESGVYTEGGLVYVPESEDGKDPSKETRNLLRDIMGFTRHERLDVKKPGPPASPPADTHLIPPKETNNIEKVLQTKEVLPANLRGDDSKKIKKLLVDHSDDEDHAPHSVDREYTHVIFKNPIDSWTTGERIVNAIGEMLNIKLTHPRVDRHEVSFRVEPNSEKKTAADVARFINDTRFKNNLSRRFGIIVIKAGVGDKTKDNSSSVSAEKVEEAKDGSDVTHVIAYMFAGAGAAAVIVIVITLLLIKKHDKKRDKLGGLQSYQIVGSESCTKDYQELCRARMAGKGNSTDSTTGRVASLSKENEARPPSSRSSTSSWSEEPALTNMDISTGHMVLSYMEDHLRNKGRLQREWEALCRYEAEPSARDAALQPQCAALNRPGAPLPFDHSRVVLNHLTNAEAMDYVNASTITDHDPRAPAYVAAQGPLATTLAHFWQMIWEQGAVVIVALCRLQENGETVCARYWPEEGSEVYHIYEVHLVSEHIWCDDYLVRSFYLKNLRTGETRTVTQFHFLSWPQSGVPSTAKALLEFRRKVNKSYRGRSCPIVVHSSNGAGRTGAYILLDLVLARMNKGAREIDIAATLEHLRDQRAGLVATRQQFEFVLMAVAEEVHAILKALPANTQNEKRDLDKDKEPIKEKTEEETAKTTKANEK